ncbi:MAG: hypothetical protein HY651_10035 [Acidobacteria bacterium]|nr:hypothetical protein [Acidobacteriota bacterium]
MGWAILKSTLNRLAPQWALRIKELLFIALAISVGSLIGRSSASSLYWSLLKSPKFESYFWPIVLGWSAFLGVYAPQIHQIKESYAKMSWPLKIQQFFLNFLGGFIGSVILYLFLQTNNFDGLAGWEKLILLAISFLSITGYLPYILIQRGLPWK